MVPRVRRVLVCGGGPHVHAHAHPAHAAHSAHSAHCTAYRQVVSTAAALYANKVCK